MRGVLETWSGGSGSVSVFEYKIVISEPHFQLSDDLLRDLESLRRARQPPDPSEELHDAFLLDPGLGPATYLKRDGRIVWEDDGWGVKPTRAHVYLAIIAGAAKTGLARLRDLLPSRPADAVDCKHCDASGRFSAHGQMRDVHGAKISIACIDCAGLGWTSAQLDTSLTSVWVPAG